MLDDAAVCDSAISVQTPTERLLAHYVERTRVETKLAVKSEAISGFAGPCFPTALAAVTDMSLEAAAVEVSRRKDQPGRRNRSGTPDRIVAAMLEESGFMPVARHTTFAAKTAAPLARELYALGICKSVLMSSGHAEAALFGRVRDRFAKTRPSVVYVPAEHVELCEAHAEATLRAAQAKRQAKLARDRAKRQALRLERSERGYCDLCGPTADGTEMLRVRGWWLCEHCAVNNRCDECGRIAERLTGAGRGRRVCAECAETERCGDCGCAVTAANRAGAGAPMCRPCFDTRFENRPRRM